MTEKIINRMDIIGLGALGTMYADFFSRNMSRENVRVLADRERTDKYKRDGVTFNGRKCDLNFCAAEEETVQSQLLVFAVKYGNLQDAIREKLMCNVGVNQTVTLFEGTYAAVQAEGRAREMMKEAMRETVKVANAEGVGLSENDVIKWTQVIDGLNSEGEPSMRQDAKAGRKTEKALFSGTVCALGDKHGIDTPVNDLFFEKIN